MAAVKTYRIVPYTRKALASILQIERFSFDDPWTEEELLKCLRNRITVCYVVEDEAGSVDGFMVYEMHRNRLRLLNIAVRWPGRGIGSQLVRHLADKAREINRKAIYTEVRERNLDAQKFFRAMGFKCEAVWKQFYETADDDAYCFVLRI